MDKGKMSDYRLVEQGRKFEFYAFVSYKHADKKWAKWVQKQLEYYRLPSNLQKEHKTPEHISPICRDDTDFSGGRDVEWHLSDKVGKSKYLIVICSKRMQINPVYIDYEVEAFLAAGNPVWRILPLVIDGEPNSADPAEECLPPALKRLGNRMPVCIFLERGRRKEALLKLVSSILEIDLKVIRSHDQVRKQRQTIQWLALGLGCALMMAFFVGWQLFRVKETGLREQLIYAEDRFRQGDRLGSLEIAQAVLGENLALMDDKIGEDAQALARLASIQPKYQPLTELCAVTEDSRAMFTADGNSVLVINANMVRKYDMQGRLTMSFEMPREASRIVTVSADGVHAVVMTMFLGDKETALWLWDMEENQAISYLVGSDAYSEQNYREGNYDSVVNASFSPDGRILCAYRDGAGFFNEAGELAAWDSQSGQKIFSFPTSELGSANLVELNAFEFIGNDTLHWDCGSNHVFYTIGDDEPVIMSRQRLPKVSDKSTDSLADIRFTVGIAKDGSGTQVRNLISGEYLDFPGAVDCVYAELGERYLLLSFYNGGLVDEVALVDLHSMSLLPSQELSELCRGHELEIKNYNGGSGVYMLLDGRRLVRYDLESGDCLSLNLHNAQGYELIGSTGTADILARTEESYVSIAELSGEALSFYSLYVDQAEFLNSALVPAAGDAPHLLARHNGSYYIFPMIEQGQRLDEGVEHRGEAIYAVAPGGELVLMGTGERLCVWRDGELLADSVFPGEIIALDADSEGRYFALSAGHFELFDADGASLGTLTPAAGRKFSSARMDDGGSRILLLSGEEGKYKDNCYELELFDGESLALIAKLSDKIHVAPGGLHRIAYDISPGGEWVSAVVRNVVNSREQYYLGVHLWKASDGTLAAQTQGISESDVPSFNLMDYSAAATRMRYVTFPSESTLLCGLKYGTWILDLEKLETRAFAAESFECEALPLMPDEDRLIYPSDGAHIWTLSGDACQKERILSHPTESRGDIALFDEGKLHNVCLSGDGKWLALSGDRDSWLYSSSDWEHSSRIASRAVELLYVDDQRLVYAADDGLWYIRN